MTRDRDQPPFGFVRDKPGTNARTEAEADIETLRQRGGLFVEAVARTRMPMAVTDARLPGNPIVFANDAFLRLAGYSMQEVMGQKPHFLNGPDTDPQDAARFREALRRGEDIVVDSWQYRKDGSRFFAAVFVSPILGEDGQVIQHFLSYLDITRRVVAEDEIRSHASELEASVEERTRALAESETRLTTVLEGVGEAFYALDCDWRFLFASRFALKTWGKRAEDLLGRKFLDCFPEAEGSEIYEAHRRVMQTGVAERLETISPPLDHWLEVDLTGSDAGGLSVAFRDIHKRRLAETALRESEERLREFGEASQDVLWIRDAETWQWTYLTPAFETIYGLSRDEARSGDNFRRWLGLILPEDRALAEAKIAEVRGGARVAFEFRIRRPSDGAVRWLRNTDFPIRDASGQVALIGGVGTDITDRKRAEEHQQVLVAELQHRVRNTLGVVRSIARRTAQNSESVEDLSAHFEGRLDAFARVQAMVTRRPEAGVDLATLIEDELVAHAAREGEFVTVTGDDVALATRPAETLSLAFHELATNAVKYGALGSEGGRLAVGWTLADGRLTLTWVERGVTGLAPEPGREGFGLELLCRVVPYELSAETEVEFRPDGLAFTLAMPAEGNIRPD